MARRSTDCLLDAFISLESLRWQVICLVLALFLSRYPSVNLFLLPRERPAFSFARSIYFSLAVRFSRAQLHHI